MSQTNPIRCPWPGNDLMKDYHDNEWGVPVHDDDLLFGHLILDGAQAGLSWAIILRKRDGYRKAFDNFNAEKMARYDSRRITRLLADPGIIRNRLKIESAISNARAYLKLREELGSFDHFLWQFVDGRPVINRWSSMKQLPAQSPESEAMSKALKGRGFRFVGPTICYAFMQAVGMVNDHMVDCFRHSQLSKKSKR